MQGPCWVTAGKHGLRNKGGAWMLSTQLAHPGKAQRALKDIGRTRKIVKVLFFLLTFITGVRGGPFCEAVPTSGLALAAPYKAANGPADCV